MLKDNTVITTHTHTHTYTHTHTHYNNVIRYMIYYLRDVSNKHFNINF